jgi:hypothetical protein
MGVEKSLRWGLPGLVFALSGAAAGDECATQAPLISPPGWKEIQLATAPEILGEWPLPLSSEKPDVLTAARVRLTLLKDGKARLEFTFVDPKPYGIPFTFQRAELLWDGPDGPRSVSIDWSMGCAYAGRSLYPGQSWAVEMDLPDALADGTFEMLRFRLRGSRF